jgi:hypothetical protein
MLACLKAIADQNCSVPLLVGLGRFFADVESRRLAGCLVRDLLRQVHGYHVRVVI